MSISEWVYKEWKGLLKWKWVKRAPVPWNEKIGWDGLWDPFKIKINLCSGLKKNHRIVLEIQSHHQGHIFKNPLKVFIESTDFTPSPDFLWRYKAIDTGFFFSSL